ncbi:hypothetical protein P691DRAFT_688520, partial [Macrolepiota fuliginosa MF-IS2]
MGGKVLLMNGDLYFLPNCSRIVDLSTPTPSDLTTLFTPSYSITEHFQNPRWWTPETEWLAFVPSLPVTFTGTL